MTIQNTGMSRGLTDSGVARENSAGCTEGFRLLHIEDNELDAIALKRAFKSLGLSPSVIRACDGVEALKELPALVGENPNAPQLVILLDINMPRMNGLEFLRELRNDPALADLPVFILTTSNQPADISKAHEGNVAGYIVKPLLPGEFVERVRRLHEFLTISEFPKNGYPRS